MFKASDVKELRERTGAGMLDCKKALEACSGDMDKSIDWLREKGIAKAAKKEGRIASEGLTVGAANDNDAIIFEVNCETDFVTQNDKFKDLLTELRGALLFNSCNTLDEAREVKLGDGKTVAERIIEATATIGEKISLRRFEKITKNDDEVFGIYSHMGGKITSVVVLKGADRDVARDVAMHIAAMNPVCLNKEDVPEEMLEHEKSVIKEQVMNEGKPADIAEKMVNGRINKYYKEICLSEQEFIKDSSVNVNTYVKNNGGEIIKFVRYEVGEGIEKKEENFAEEVMSQVNAA
ncbi:MAG: elongation factor Ts [Bacilli bacterium]|nr:elongation factor Ts [Bacilli bacterium]